MKRESALVGFALVALSALGAAVALARCSGAEQRPAEAAAAPPDQPVTSEPAGETPSPAGKSVALPAHSAAAVPVSGAANLPGDADAAAVPSAAPTSGAGSRIARALAASHPADLRLLASIERELQREPPPEVHAMLRRRGEGASRDELVASARALPDLQLRVLALRWVDEVEPAAGAEPPPPRVPTPGSATPFVKPIERAP